MNPTLCVFSTRLSFISYLYLSNTRGFPRNCPQDRSLGQICTPPRAQELWTARARLVRPLFFSLATVCVFAHTCVRVRVRVCVCLCVEPEHPSSSPHPPRTHFHHPIPTRLICPLIHSTETLSTALTSLTPNSPPRQTPPLTVRAERR